jgi:predicted MPP superfamily phosphohydrolase
MAKARRSTRKKPARGTPAVETFHARAARWLGYLLAGAVSLVILLVLLTRFLGAGPLVRGLLATLLLINAAWWLTADRIVEEQAPKNWRRPLRCVLAVYVALVCLPVLDAFLSRGVPSLRHVPVTLMMVIQLWHILLVLGFFVWPGWVGIRVLRTAIGNWRRKRRRRPTKAMEARRAFLQRTFVTAPLIITGAASAVGAIQAGRFRVNRYRALLPNWPRELSGLTITHVGDLHVGRFFRPRELDPVILASNGLNSDLIVVTGDIIDLSIDLLPVTLTALRKLQAPLGVYLVIGNHDLIDDGPRFVSQVRSAGLDLLIDESRSIRVGDRDISLLGLDWARSGYEEHVRRAMAGVPEDGPRLALTHHPHAFDALADAGVDLVLAGHTHGGQIMFTSPHKPEPVGIGSLIFRYTRGFYRRGQSTLFVTTGVGNWFPVRMNAPAEIAHLTIA